MPQVTGANQGIGFEIVRQLCEQFDGKVLLAARDVRRGEEAVEKLELEGLHPVFLELDVDSEESIEAAKRTVEEEYGRLDILVNNAAVLFRKSSGLTLCEKASRTIKTNYYGVLKVINIFTPLLQPNSRIINMSTNHRGKISLLSARRQKQILSPTLTIEELSALMDEFVSDAKSLDDYDEKDWPDANGEFSSYNVSKIGVNRLTELLVDEFSRDPSKAGILINSVGPGWVRTNMGTMEATRSVQQGADTPVYLALLPAGTTEPNGQMVKDRLPVNWKQ